MLWWNWGWGTWLATWEQWSIPGQGRAHLDPVHPSGEWVSLASSTATGQCHWLEESGFFHLRMQEVETSLLQDGIGEGSQEWACLPGITRYKICGSKTNHRPYLLVDWGCCLSVLPWAGQVSEVAGPEFSGGKSWLGGPREIPGRQHHIPASSSSTFVPSIPPTFESLRDLWIPTATETHGRFLLAIPSHHLKSTKDFFLHISCPDHRGVYFVIILDSFLSWTPELVGYQILTILLNIFLIGSSWP